MHQQAHLPKGNYFHYVLGRMRNRVAPTPKRKLQLNKCKVRQRCFHDRAHKVPMKGIIDCNLVLTVPNRQQILLTQCIMSVKTQVNFQSSLFLGVDVQEDGLVIVPCDRSMCEEAEAFYLI